MNVCSVEKIIVKEIEVDSGNDSSIFI